MAPSIQIVWLIILSLELPRQPGFILQIKKYVNLWTYGKYVKFFETFHSKVDDVSLQWWRCTVVRVQSAVRRAKVKVYTVCRPSADRLVVPL